MSAPSVLERNLLALAANHSQLGALLSRSEPARELVFLNSRSGSVVPALSAGGRTMQMHSLVDPLREGQRHFESFRGAGYLLFLGLGGGYQVLPCLGEPDVSRILIVERDVSFLRSVLERIDLRELLLDERLRLLVAEEPKAVKEFLLSDYLPAIYGDLKTVPLRPSVEAAPQYYRALMEAVQEVIGLVADDYTVQAQFGKKWFVNTLANLPAVAESTLTVKPVKRVFLTGAGPSLEMQIPTLAEIRESGFLIASDTSLPSLLSYGLVPDLILSIDCQLVSYHHFLQGLPDQVPLLLDLASPPVLTRLSRRTAFFASNHPLSAYLADRWRPLPFIDTSGGNVSHAAVSLALFLGAREIYLLGTDFSYPEGKAYSRGTYLFHLFRSQEQRLAPLESLFLSFILTNKTISKEWTQGMWRYTTRPLIGYKERLEGDLRLSAARVIPLPGKGVPLNLVGGPRPSSAAPGRILAAGAPKSDWQQFLRTYRQGLQSLPAPTAPVSRYLFELPEEQRALWVTLYPAAAAFREQQPRVALQEHRLLARVRDWSISVADRFLDR